jgi:hypothetical protein
MPADSNSGFLCNKDERGLLAMGGWAGSGVVTIFGVAYFSGSFPTSEWETVKINQTIGGLGLMAAGLFGVVYVYIWSTVDASRVAKINNRAFRDRNLTGFHSGTEQSGNAYKPAAIGAASFLIPGAGHLFMDETHRGLGFLGGLIVWDWLTLKALTDDLDFWSGLILIGDLGIRGWAAYDAAHIAKFKNQACRDQDNTTSSVRISPYLGSSGIPGIYNNLSAGLILSMTF